MPGALAWFDAFSLMDGVTVAEVELNCIGTPPGDIGDIGDMAMGMKNGSTVGFVIAVWRAVRNLRGPAGLGIIMMSGSGIAMAPYSAMMDCTTSFTSL
jgi:hypothetical protein